ncbi:MAG: DUF2130 domain-containing protein [Gammaproteobacteria bacterium]|nr:DUF2130 domain-containing protein [Gammaproteobacteria bacterium]
MEKRIILNADELITCPKCSHEFPLHAGITQQMIERYEDEYDRVLAGERKALEARLTHEASRAAAKSYETKIEALQGQLKDQAEASENLKAQMKSAARHAAEAARADAEQQILDMREALTGKEKKLAEYQEQERKLRQQKRELEEAQKEFDIRLERQLEAEKAGLETRIAEGFQQKEAKLLKQIADAQKANAELQRKLEQGSQQLQGEVLELQLEDFLKSTFPFDEVSPVAKGTHGADVLQTVTTRAGANCGRIIWETKNTRNWANSWVQKLKDDQQSAGAEIAVLVSTAFPGNGQEAFLQHEGIWLVRPNTIEPVAQALRTILIESQKQKVINEGRNEKAEALYDYLCSPQFAQKIRGVIEAYDAMKADLEAEKKAMARLWKKREGQLERITSNIIGMAGELQGISQESLAQLDAVAAFPLDDDSD